MNTTSQIQSAAIQLKVSTGIAPNDAPFSGQTLALDPHNVTMVEAKSYQHFRLEQNGQVIENPNLDERGDDLIVTAPDGSTLVLLGFVPLAASGASSFVQDSRDLEEQGSDDIDDRQIPKEALAQTQAEAEPATDGEQTGDNSQAMDAVAANSDSTAQALNDLSESSMPEEEAEEDDDDFGILFWAGAGRLGSAGIASFLANDEGNGSNVGDGSNSINYNVTANLGPRLGFS